MHLKNGNGIGEQVLHLGASNPLILLSPTDIGLHRDYLFDFGDKWTFEVRKLRGSKTPEAGVKYPRIIEAIGPNPQQYPIHEEYEEYESMTISNPAAISISQKTAKGSP